MISKKQVSLIIGCVLLCANYGFAQQKMDIGNFITLGSDPQIGIEFRKPIYNQYWFKLGATFSGDNNSFGEDTRRIVSVSDTMIIERVKHYAYGQGGLRIGAERRFKTSMFTLGADLNINYRKTERSNFNRISRLNEDSTWSSVGSYTTEFTPLSDPSASRITQHFIVPNLRISFNMYAPLGKSFLLHLFAAGSFGTPIYMGATNVRDAQNEFLGTPPSVFDFDTQAGIGLRYIIRKKE